jgi:hypothetical protein
MVEEIIDQWILENYGKLADSEKFEIMKTFELYWDQFNFPYAEIKTLKNTHPPRFLQTKTQKKTNTKSKNKLQLNQK